MKYLIGIFIETIFFFNEIAIYLVFGLLVAGLLHVLFPDAYVKKHLGKGDWKNIFKGALFGLPLPLCSCGVVPVAASLRRNGASKGSVVSFLITTPQVGADSFMITYSLLGWVFAVFRIIASLFTALFAGIFVNINKDSGPENAISNNNSAVGETARQRLKRILRYIEFELLGSIINSLLVGILIAGLISFLLPNDFLAAHLDSDFLSMLLMLAVGIPLYVCASASTPIAASLVLKGLSPGAALVFLLSGPATNAANMAMVTKIIGKKGTAIYLSSIALGSLLAGYFFNFFIKNSGLNIDLHQHLHSALPLWLHLVGSILLGSMILYYFFKTNFIRSEKRKERGMDQISLRVEGMTCPHCSATVQKVVESVPGTSDVIVFLDKKRVDFQMESDDLVGEVKKNINAAGYTVLD